jgi:hypothetical protein
MLILSVELFEKKLVTNDGEEALYLMKLYREKMSIPK